MCCHLGEGFPSPQWQLFAVAERCRILVSFFRSDRLGRASCFGAVGGGGGGGVLVFCSPNQRYKDTRSWVSFQHALGLTSTRPPGVKVLFMWGWGYLVSGTSPFLCLLPGYLYFFFSSLMFALAAEHFVRPISVIRIPVCGYPFSMHLGLLVHVRLLLEGFCRG